MTLNKLPVKTKFIPYTIILFFLYVIFYLQECQPSHKCPSIHSDTITQTTITEIPVDHYFPKPSPVTVVDSFFQHVDTAEILAACMDTWQEYSKLRVYNRELINDSFADLSITDTVQYNELKGYALLGHFQSVTNSQIVTQSTVPKQKLQLYIGAQFGSDLQNFAIVPSAYLITSKNHFYSLGYNPFQKFGYLGFAWKMHF